MKKTLARLWRDSRAAIYAVTFAAVTASYGLVHAHGFPKSHADWTLVGWAALAAALGVAGRYIDPLIAALAKKASIGALGGRQIVNQDQLAALVAVEVAKIQADAAARAAGPSLGKSTLDVTT